MILQTYVGRIRPEMILDCPGGPGSWGLQWLKYAQNASEQGNELVVFEVSQNEIIMNAGDGISGMEFISDLVMPAD
jgi:hypothetical protein